MTAQIKLLAFMPISAVGNIYVSGSGIERGDMVAQVVDTVSGADVTSSFDPYILDTDTVTQLNTTPSSSDVHLAVLASVPAADVSFRIAVVNSLGSGAGTHGSVTAAGVQAGDIIMAALYPMTTGAAVSVTSVIDNFATTAPTANTITQISGVSTAYSVLLFLLKNGMSSTEFMVGLNAGASPGTKLVVTAPAGASLVWAVDLNTGVALTGNYDPYVPSDGSVIQASGTYSDMIAFVFQNAVQ